MAVVAEEYVNMAQADSEAEVPETLFHTLLTVIDYEADQTGSVRTVYPLGTHTDLAAAKNFARHVLDEHLGYKRDDFETYEERSTQKQPEQQQEWPYGDGVLVHAVRQGPHHFLVSLATTPNNERLPRVRDPLHHELELPTPSERLHYVLQTKVDYHADRSGEVQTTDVEGVYARRADAHAAARRALLPADGEMTVRDFAQYDERGADVADDEWPFGEDVVVHAVAPTGENYRVAVRTVPGVREVHSKMARARKH